jgi:Clostridial hydrophobic W
VRRLQQCGTTMKSSGGGAPNIDISLERISSLYVERGLHLLRYERKSLAAEPPVASVSQADGCESSIQIISSPGATPGELPFPGSCVVILANASGALHVSVRRRNAEGSLDATLRLESLAPTKTSESAAGRLMPGVVGSRVASSGPSAQPRPTAPKIVVMGHVAHRGDVEAAGGDWIAGPASPSPIEGIEIRSSSGPSLGVEAQVMVGGQSPKWSDWVPSGSFAGTRGRRLPLVGVRLRLQGADAEQFELVADAVFLGSPIASKRGRETEFLSAGAGDPLVGFRLSVQPAEGVEARSQELKAWQLPESRVRVFRATERR